MISSVKLMGRRGFEPLKHFATGTVCPLKPFAYLPLLDRVDFHATKFRLKVTSSITGDHNHFLLYCRGFHLLYLRREYTAITRSMENRTPDTAVKGRWLNHLPMLRFYGRFGCFDNMLSAYCNLKFSLFP